jgi:hypothetical protein
MLRLRLLGHGFAIRDGDGCAPWDFGPCDERGGAPKGAGAEAPHLLVRPTVGWTRPSSGGPPLYAAVAVVVTTGNSDVGARNRFSNSDAGIGFPK